VTIVKANERKGNNPDRQISAGDVSLFQKGKEEVEVKADTANILQCRQKRKHIDRMRTQVSERDSS
jgi:hypothetical protein